MKSITPKLIVKDASAATTPTTFSDVVERLRANDELFDRGRGLRRRLDHREMRLRRNALDAEPRVARAELLLGFEEGRCLRLAVDVQDAGRRRVHPLVRLERTGVALVRARDRAAGPPPHLSVLLAHRVDHGVDLGRVAAGSPDREERLARLGPTFRRL